MTLLTAAEVSQSARAFLAAVSVAPDVLELRPGYRVLMMVAAHDPQHGQAAVLDGEDGEQQDPGGGAGVAGQGQGGGH
jgi:hypothetical protein